MTSSTRIHRLARALAVAACASSGACAKDNPAWLDGQASTSAVDTGDPTTDTTLATTTSADPTAGSADTAETTPETTSGTTSEPLPLCGPLVDAVVQLDLFPDKALCEAGLPLSFKVTNGDGPPQAQLCLQDLCNTCVGEPVVLDPELDWIPQGTCLSLVHYGIWAPGDPEALSGCKTLGLRAYLNDDLATPVLIASSRVFDPPPGLPPALALAVQRADEVPCACDLDACCADADASRYSLRFVAPGLDLTLAPGQSTVVVLGGQNYLLQALRAHRRALVEPQTMACAEPQDLVDWQLLRLLP